MFIQRTWNGAQTQNKWIWVERLTTISRLLSVEDFPQQTADRGLGSVMANKFE